MSAALAHLRGALDAAVIGHADAKTALLLGWLARAHVLLEGPPGCGKSALAHALAAALGEPSPAAPLAASSVLRRERDGSSERIRLERAPLALGAVCVLDDVDRASDLPPQLLAALDRDDGPFLVATRGARGARDPLPSVQGLLERCALRVRLRGMIDGWREAELRALLERTARADPPIALPPERVGALRAQLERVPIDASVLEEAARVRVDQRLARVLPRLLRAHALLRGSARAERVDLDALLQLVSHADEVGTAPQADARETLASVASPGSARAASEAGDGAGHVAGAQAEAVAASDRALAPAAFSATTLDASAVESLVAALAGRWGRGRAAPQSDASGAPRRRRPLRDFAESVDADPAELLAYIDAETPERPAVLQRERRGATPALLILRDVSASMQGPGARWSLRLVRALVDAARGARLRVGYLEFHHAAERFLLRGRFVHRAYTALSARAAQAACAGRTSYQAALRAALDARLPRAACDVVLISDGIPVVGDPSVRRERALARARGWRIHAVFVGLPPVPPVLVELARESSGLAFCVAPAPSREATWSLRALEGHGR